MATTPMTASVYSTRYPATTVVSEPAVPYQAIPMQERAFSAQGFDERAWLGVLRSPAKRSVFWQVDDYLETLKDEVGQEGAASIEAIRSAADFWRSIKQDPRLNDIAADGPIHGVTTVIAGARPGSSPGRVVPWDARRPVVSVGADGAIQLAWTDQRRHVEIEFLANGFSAYAMDFRSRRDMFLDESMVTDPLEAAFQLLFSPF